MLEAVALTAPMIKVPGAAMVGPISKLEEGPSEEKEETVLPSAAVATELTIKFILP